MSIASQCSVLFIVVLVGVFCRKRGIFTDEVIRGVTQLVVNITVPALLISSMQRPFEREVLMGVLQTMFFSSLIVLASLAIGFLLFRSRTQDRRTVMASITAFTNCGFMGFPIVLAFNPDWMIYAVTFSSTNALFVWSLGTMLFASKDQISIKRLFFSLRFEYAVITTVQENVEFFHLNPFPFYSSNAFRRTASITAFRERHFLSRAASIFEIKLTGKSTETRNSFSFVNSFSVSSAPMVCVSHDRAAAAVITFIPPPSSIKNFPVFVR